MYEYKCVIDRVVDGDTVDIDIDLGFDVKLTKQRVRLMGVDTPESRTSDKEEKVYGKIASAYVKDLLPVGSTQTFTCKEYNTSGKFGRLLGDFKIGDSSICQMLIESHNAVPYHGQSKEDIAEAHLENRKWVNLTKT
jgi:micrococcal nuclease